MVGSSESSQLLPAPDILASNPTFEPFQQLNAALKLEVGILHARFHPPSSNVSPPISCVILPVLQKPVPQPWAIQKAHLSPNLSAPTLIRTFRQSGSRTAATRLTTIHRHLSSSSPTANMAPTSKECDYLVIGGGSGGLASARRASSLYGAKTIAIESKKLGGTCVNVGCVPKKVTWNAASIAQTLHQAPAYGFHIKETAPFDWPAFKKKRDAYVGRLNGIYEKNLSNDKVEYIHGHAKITSPNSVEVKLDDGSTTSIKTKHLLIATGGHPNIPHGIPGADLGITSDGFFELETLPKKAAIVGGGYIAVEMAGMLHALGTEVHLFIRKTTFLRNFDPMIQQAIGKEYRRQGVILHCESTIAHVAPSKDSNLPLDIQYKDSDGEGAFSADTLLWAIGRSPEVEHLNLGAADVKQNERGQIVVDDYQNTSTQNVYALGDVCGRVELTPVAIAAGRRLADRVFGGKSDAKLNYDNIPSVVFAHPEVGSIGLSEPQAREKYGDKDVKVYQTSFPAMWYAMMEQNEKGPTSYKIVCVGKEEKVVGLHILGEGSSEILQGFGVAIKMGATKKDFDSCVAIHPTSAEELVTMK